MSGVRAWMARGVGGCGVEGWLRGRVGRWVGEWVVGGWISKRQRLMILLSSSFVHIHIYIHTYYTLVHEKNVCETLFFLLFLIIFV